LHHLRSLNVCHFGVIDVTFSVFTSIQNSNQIYQSVQTLSGGGGLFTHLRSCKILSPLLPSEGGTFIALKIHCPWPNFNPRTLVPVESMLTTRPPRI
jgi:hypothetical protein